MMTTLTTSGDWIADEDCEVTFEVFKFMCSKFRQLVDVNVEINQCDLSTSNCYGFCQDNGGEFLIHVHNDLSCEEYVTTLIHELIHVKQTIQGLGDHEMRESEAYFWERLLCKEYMTTPTSGTMDGEKT